LIHFYKRSTQGSHAGSSGSAYQRTVATVLGALHEISSLAGQVLDMYMSRVAYVWYVLLTVSVLLLFYFGGRMAGMEDRTARFRQPAFTPDTRSPLNSAKRGLKTNKGSTERSYTYLQESSTKKLIPRKNLKISPGYEILRTRESTERRNRMKKLHYSSANKKSKVKHPTIFSLADFKPGKENKPTKYGLNVAKSRLNYEFSNANDSFKANTLQRIPNFVSSKANVMNIVDNIRVGHNVPVESARQILIATTWRSGSTFLGDLLNHYKGTFYYFEPLHYYSKIKDLSKVQNETSFLKSLYTCKFNSDNLGFLHHVSQGPNKFLFENHNFRLWKTCHNLLPNDLMCFMPDYLNRVCPLFPIKLIKTVRFRVKNVEELLQDSAMNLKVVVLVRDPRGVYNSRSSGAVKTWCKKDLCADPEVGCRDLNSDIQAAFDLEERYPGRVKLVRYEDLSMFPEDTSMDMLSFLDLPYTDGIADYIASHTSKEKMKVVKNKKTHKKERKQNPYGTAKNSSATAFAWRDKMGFKKTTNIQEACQVPMAKLGYKLVLNEEDMRSEDLPIEKTAEEVWPFE